MSAKVEKIGRRYFKIVVATILLNFRLLLLTNQLIFHGILVDIAYPLVTSLRT